MTNADAATLPGVPGLSIVAYGYAEDVRRASVPIARSCAGPQHYFPRGDEIILGCKSKVEVDPA